MGETGVIRVPGSYLDPQAREFRPSCNNNDVSISSAHQIYFFGPPPQHVYYQPYAGEPLPYEGGAVGLYPSYSLPAVPPPPYVNTVPPLPPSSVAPTRTLLLSSVPRDVSETAIRRELEVFGEVRGVQMEKVCDGAVTVHFYDLRHAERALKEIREQHMQEQSRVRNGFSAWVQIEGFDGRSMVAPPPTAARGLIAGCAVWPQFIIPACNAVPDGHNQGTIVVFNLDPNVSSSSLKELFKAYGAVKELRETPLKKQQRFVEFYDVRDAAKALREMNGKEIHGKQVVIEFSRPGGYGRKFFNATAKSFCANDNAIINSINSSHKKTSKYITQHPPQPSPLSGRFSVHSPFKIPSRSLMTQSQFSTSKKASNSRNVSPKESVDEKGSIDASMDCLSLSGVVGDDSPEKITDGASKRSVRKSLNNSSTGNTKPQQPRNRPWKGKQSRKLDSRFLINEDVQVESSRSDSRTTLMIKNIPNKYSQKLLLNMLDNHCIHCNEQIGDGDDQLLSSYDFVYLPIDFNNKCNVGYGFVNMTSPQAAWRLYKAFHHQHWEVFNSRKICEVTYARVQGLEALKEHFKNSKFPCEMDHYLPVVFEPPRDGRIMSEPLPIVGHKQQHMIILDHPMKCTPDRNEMDGGDILKNDDDHQEEERNLNRGRNGGDATDDDDKLDRSNSGDRMVSGS
ncbi:hypothetical protein K2173_002618 [Erythroxylum novogranatense]|uniref:RRM domain-containing protein n=1 Tax=Erythroxylum novogranatense TaxID=1862640 RepID=A0AAV8SXJ0_9ROSI|nr:hypothetical protein K2173_002618 [Erythroxylum novogranatense]